MERPMPHLRTYEIANSRDGAVGCAYPKRSHVLPGKSYTKSLTGLLLILVLAAQPGCARDRDDSKSRDRVDAADSDSRDNAPPAEMTPTPATTNSGLYVPAKSAPSVCSTLANNKAIRQLPTTLQRISANGENPALVASAAEALRSFTDSFPKASAAASSLEQWSKSPSDLATNARLDAAFKALDEEVQPRCHFPAAS